MLEAFVHVIGRAGELTRTMVVSASAPIMCVESTIGHVRSVLDKLSAVEQVEQIGGTGVVLRIGWAAKSGHLVHDVFAACGYVADGKPRPTDVSGVSGHMYKLTYLGSDKAYDLLARKDMAKDT
jgi:hypothetical protein